MYDSRGGRPERRRYPRVPYPKEVIAYAAMRRLRCRGFDLGAGGIRLEPPRGAEGVERLRLNLLLERGRTVVVDGELVRDDPSDPRAWAVRFEQVPAAILSQISAYIERERERRGLEPATPASDLAEEARRRLDVAPPRTNTDLGAPPAARASTPTPAVPPPVLSPSGDDPVGRSERSTPRRLGSRDSGAGIQQRQERDTYGRAKAKRGSGSPHADTSGRRDSSDIPGRVEVPFGSEDSLESLRERHQRLARSARRRRGEDSEES